MTETTKVIVFDVVLPALATAAFVGIALIARTRKIEEHTIKEGWLALIVALVVCVASLAAQALLKADDAEERLQTAMGFRNAVHDAEELRQFKSLAESYSSVSAGKYRFAKGLAREIVEDAGGKLRDLTDGKLYVSVERESSCTYPVTALNAAHALFATSFVRPERFWGSSCGQIYFDANRRALERNATITRVFLISPGDIQASIPIVQQHLSMAASNNNRIQIRVGCMDRMPSDLQTDFGLFDDSYVIQLNLSPSSRDVVGVTYTSDARDIENIRSKRDRINAASQQIKDINELGPAIQKLCAANEHGS
jgi:hypothetical protein